MRIEKIEYPAEQNNKTIREECKKTAIDTIKKYEENGQSIGKGKTAEIFVSPRNDKFCMKAVCDKGISCNNTEIEMNFLEILADSDIAPKPICAIKTSQKDYLFMETIHGISIKDLIEKDLVEDLPPKFDFKNFFETLKQQISLMHKKNIYHRDLHTGNIMINSDGSPVIIDFGDALLQKLGEDDPYRDENGKGELIVYPNDKNSIGENYRKMGEYLKSKGYFDKNNK